MKLPHLFLVFILSVLLVSILLPSRSPDAFFYPVDADQDSLQSESSSPGSSSDEQKWAFEYGIPQNRKLIASLVAKLDGEIVPAMTRFVHIVPPDPSRACRGDLHITYRPNHQVEQPIGPVWTLDCNLPGLGSRFGMGPSFSPPDAPGGGGSQIGSSGSVLEENLDLETWKYHTRGYARSGEDLFDFRYTLTIRLTELEEKDEPGTIRSREL